MQPSSGKSRLRPWRSDCRQVGLVEVYKRIKGAGVHLGHLIVSEVKEPEALEAREHAAVEGGNLVVPEEKLVSIFVALANAPCSIVAMLLLLSRTRVRLALLVWIWYLLRPHQTNGHGD